MTRNRRLNVIWLIDTISKGTGLIAGLAVIALVVFTFIEAMMRYIAEHSIWVSYDVIWLLYGTSATLSGAYALHKGIHTRVTVILDVAPTPVRSLLENLDHLLVIPFAMLVLILGATQEAVFSWRVGERSPMTGITPVYPFKTLIVIAFVILLLQNFSEWIKKRLKEKEVDRI